MLRFMLRYQALHPTGLQRDGVFTLDIDVPELEKQLARGGYGEMGYEQVSLVGVEAIVSEAAQRDKEEKP